jgi:hypothetical protein
MDRKLQIFVQRRSSCCGERQMLVQSRPGGFITKNCCGCGKPSYVGLHELPELPCRKCGTPMSSSMRFNNYSFACTDCGSNFQLYTRLPWWHQRFPYSGIATPDESRLIGSY